MSDDPTTLPLGLDQRAVGLGVNSPCRQMPVTDSGYTNPSITVNTTIIRRR